MSLNALCWYFIQQHVNKRDDYLVAAVATVWWSELSTNPKICGSILDSSSIYALVYMQQLSAINNTFSGFA